MQILQRSDGSSKHGLTVIELLIVIACVSLLLAITSAAVLQARSAARATECRNKLRQLGIASHNFASANDHLPKAISHFYDLLPYLDEGNLHQELEKLDPRERVTQMFEASGSLPQFVCPADPLAEATNYNTNYRLNMGTAWGYDHYRSLYNGMVSGDRGTRPINLQDVRDGQSNTVHYAERLVKVVLPHSSPTEANSIGLQNQKRVWWQLPKDYSYGQEIEFARECRMESNRRTFETLSQSGRVNSLLSSTPSWYDHMLPPNSPACRGGNRTVVATSEHSGGVHVLLVDGSVRFVNESIDADTWSAVGTRASGEIVNW